jgi:hypothetical protein
MLLGRTGLDGGGVVMKVGGVFSHGLIVREIVLRFLAREARDLSHLEMSRQAVMCGWVYVWVFW